MVLLDTHVLLWMLFDDSQLSTNAVYALQHQLCSVSIVSVWEIAIKTSLGKLKLPKTLQEICAECLKMGITILDITSEDCMTLQGLSWIHRDPFDRMILSQAIHGNMPVITHDGKMKRYDAVSIIW